MSGTSIPLHEPSCRAARNPDDLCRCVVPTPSHVEALRLIARLGGSDTGRWAANVAQKALRGESVHA